MNRYPTRAHERAAAAIADFFAADPETQAVLLVNSCARGRATPDSCLDVVVLQPAKVLVADRESVEANWIAFYREAPVFEDLHGAGEFSVVHLDVVDGEYHPPVRDWAGGPDGFELEIGNHLAYSVPLFRRGDRLEALRAQWLPFYGEDLRERRLGEARHFCRDNLQHLRLFVPRGLLFQSLERFHHAYKDFLQALFIARRTYPIAYDKWIHEQIVEMLGEPGLYAELLDLFSIPALDGETLLRKAGQVESLLDRYAAP